MDNVTHTLFALTLARTPLGRVGRGATVALVLASNAPDIDIVATAGGAARYLHWHRGPTHGPYGVVALGLACAAIVWGGTRLLHRKDVDDGDGDVRKTRKGRRRARRRADADAPASFFALTAVSIAAVLLHVLMDVPTSYGTRLLSPVDWHWVAVDWLPIVDVYLLAMLAAGLVLGSGSAARQRTALVALALMGANYGLRAAAHHEALAMAPQAFGVRLPAACEGAGGPEPVVERWPAPDRPAPPPDTSCLVGVTALPTFLSPFRWHLVAQLSDQYATADVDLLDRLGLPGSSSDAATPDGARPVVSVRYPNRWTPAVFQAARGPIAQTFLGFSRLPVARSVRSASGQTLVRWSDMRFLGGPTDRGLFGLRDPFTLTVTLDPSGAVVHEELGTR